jgi:hypothetical protein
MAEDTTLAGSFPAILTKSQIPPSMTVQQLAKGPIVRASSVMTAFSRRARRARRASRTK